MARLSRLDLSAAMQLLWRELLNSERTALCSTVLDGHLQNCRVQGARLELRSARSLLKLTRKASRPLAYICCLGSFLALHNLELYRVALLQALVAVARNRAVMDEHVRAIIASDEPVSFGVIEPLHSSFQAIHVPLLATARRARAVVFSCHFASASAQSQEM